MNLIFGGGGFLGASISKALNDNNMECTVVAREDTDLWRISHLKNIQIIRTKIEEQQELIKILKPETVVCANWVGVSKAERFDLNLQLTNKNVIIALGKTSIEANVKKFIAFGSQAEFSQSVELIQDDTKPEPVNDYGSVKNSLRSELEILFQNTKSTFIWARIFSVYGEFDISKSLIPELVRSAKTKKTFRLNEPARKWSYLYQSDFSSAIQCIIQNLDRSGTINVGNPNSTQISHIISLVKRHLEEYGLNLDVMSGISSISSEFWIPDSLKLINLGWYPKINVDKGIEMTIDGIMNVV